MWPSRPSRTVQIASDENINHDPSNGEFSSGGKSGASAPDVPKSAASEEFDRILKAQRAIEGTRACLRDPLTGKLYVGVTHADAYRKAPQDVKVRMSPYIHDGSFSRAPIAGFLDENDKFVSRAQNESRYGYRGQTAEGMKRLGGNQSEIVKMFHAQDRALRRTIAMDEGSVREFDADGHLKVVMTNISKAMVCPYLGREIPDYQRLGLEPGRIYQLLRDPKELRKAAETFAGKPVLLAHKPITSSQHPVELVCGAVGTNVRFVDPYLQAPLSIWRDDAISLIESNEQKELSAAYRYDADMTPGTFQGKYYDGVMRNIVGNHVALVREGRAGPDVVVGDSMENIKMSQVLLSRKAAMAQGAVSAYLLPLLAADAQIDLTPVFANVTAKNYAAMKPQIIADVRRLTAGKLAMDASVGDLAGLLDSFKGEDPKEGGNPLQGEPNSAIQPLKPVMPAKADTPAPDKGAPGATPPKVGGKDADPAAPGATPSDTPDPSLDPSAQDGEEGDVASKVTALLTGKVDDATLAAVTKLLTPDAAPDAPAVDADPSSGVPAWLDDKKDGDVKDDKKTPAMDSVSQAVARERKNWQATQAAEKFVAPWVGDLTLAQDENPTELSVLKTAALALGLPNAAKINDPVALKSMIQMTPLPGSANVSRRIAQDSATVKSFSDRFPGVKNIKVL